MTTHTIFGIFTNRIHAEDAINQLERAGFNPKDISIIMKDQVVGTQIANNTGANVANGAATGVTTGAVLGGLAGLLIGIGAIAIPGIGALLVAGPLASAIGLTGAAATTVSGAATGALAGGILGALMGLGVPEADARVYEDRIKTGAILLAVPAFEARIDEVRSILENCDADQIRSVTLPGERTTVSDNEVIDREASTHVRPAHRLGQI